MFQVRVGQLLAETITATYGPERSAGRSSEWDFWGGPLQAALLAFRDFTSLPFDDVPSIRHFVVIDPLFGAVMFTGVLLPDEVVELFAADTDGDYWPLVQDDPDD